MDRGMARSGNRKTERDRGKTCDAINCITNICDETIGGLQTNIAIGRVAIAVEVYIV